MSTHNTVPLMNWLEIMPRTKAELIRKTGNQAARCILTLYYSWHIQMHRYICNITPHLFYVKICIRWDVLWETEEAQLCWMRRDLMDFVKGKQKWLWTERVFWFYVIHFVAFDLWRMTTCMWKSQTIVVLWAFKVSCTHYMTGAGFGPDKLVLLALLLEVVWVLSSETHVKSPPQIWATCRGIDKHLEAWRGQDHFTMPCAKALRAELYPQSVKPLVQNASLLTCIHMLYNHILIKLFRHAVDRQYICLQFSL